MGMHLRARYDWNKAGRPRIALATRIGGAFLTGMAALSWPYCLFLAVARDWTLIFVPLLITTCAVVQRAGMRKVYGIEELSEEEGPSPLPEPKIPRDTSRPWPRPKGSRSKLNRVCPVCGTGRETGDLEGRVLGWPAHASCAEWLGDWQPPSAEVTELQRALDGFKDHGVSAPAAVSVIVKTSPGAQVNVGNGNRLDGSFPIASAEDLARAQEMLKNRAALANEARERINQERERLNREITALWGVPPAMLEQHTHKAGDPVPVEQCPKRRARFCGTPDYLRSAYSAHLRTGCRQSSSRPSSSGM